MKPELVDASRRNKERDLRVLLPAIFLSWQFCTVQIWLVVTLIRRTVQGTGEPCHHHYTGGHNDSKQEIIVWRCYVTDLSSVPSYNPPLIVLVLVPSLQFEILYPGKLNSNDEVNINVFPPHCCI